MPSSKLSPLWIIEYKVLKLMLIVFQYHGGTNFGRTGSAFVITSYYDEAPIDEYGK